MSASEGTPLPSEDRHVTAPDGLSVEERRILDLASARWKCAGSLEQRVRDEFGISLTRFWQRVNQLCDTESALAYSPATVNRLRRLRTSRRHSSRVDAVNT